MVTMPLGQLVLKLWPQSSLFPVEMGSVLAEKVVVTSSWLTHSLTAYHGTSAESAALILRNGFRCSSTGMLGEVWTQTNARPTGP